MLLQADGRSVITEHVWRERFAYVENLNKFGANIQIENNQIKISPTILNKCAENLTAFDVRAAAVTLLAIIASKSEATLISADHILRGYSRLKEQLDAMGIKIVYSFENVY